ncbi:MAG TPA: putative toxin-antitoxin system toxin component, PIN family [Candidatus Binatia bacterium]
MRVFLDTNVLASAAATRGLCADLFREVLASHELITSRQVLSELRRVLKVQFRAPQALINEFIELMSEDTEIAKPGELPRVNIKDKDDLSILSAAIAAKTEIFVTGDKEILDLSQIQQMAIMSPRQFWEALKNPPSQ